MPPFIADKHLLQLLCVFFIINAITSNARGILMLATFCSHRSNMGIFSHFRMVFVAFSYDTGPSDLERIRSKQASKQPNFTLITIIFIGWSHQISSQWDDFGWKIRSWQEKLASFLQQCETHRFGKYGKNIRDVTQLLYAALTKSNNTAKQDRQTPALESHQSN